MHPGLSRAGDPDALTSATPRSELLEVMLTEQVSTRAAIAGWRGLARLVVAGAMAIILCASAGGVAHASNFAPIINRGAGCLDAVNEADGITLLQVHCFNVSNEMWDNHFVGQSTDHRTGSCMCTVNIYELINKGSGKCATAITGSTTVTQAACSSDVHQWWVEHSAVLNGGRVVTIIQSFDLRCLEVVDTTDGSPVALVQEGCGGLATQQWTF